MRRVIIMLGLLIQFLRKGIFRFYYRLLVIGCWQAPHNAFCNS